MRSSDRRFASAGHLKKLLGVLLNEPRLGSRWLLKRALQTEE